MLPYFLVDEYSNALAPAHQIYDDEDDRFVCESLFCILYVVNECITTSNVQLIL